jgi:hypothetical protein
MFEGKIWINREAWATLRSLSCQLPAEEQEKYTLEECLATGIRVKCANADRRINTLHKKGLLPSDGL